MLSQHMACALRRPPSLPRTNFLHHSHPTLVIPPPSANHSYTSFFSLNRPYLHTSLNFHARLPPCLAASPGSPPPRDEGLLPLSGLGAKFLRLKDTLQIFFAVLFWMSLFFWACVWDDKNSGNPTKGSRFRR